MIDVLQGEVSRINAQGRSVPAETDIVTAAYTLLFSMGVLNLETVAIAGAPSASAVPASR